MCVCVCVCVCVQLDIIANIAGETSIHSILREFRVSVISQGMPDFSPPPPCMSHACCVPDVHCQLGQSVCGGHHPGHWARGLFHQRGHGDLLARPHESAQPQEWWERKNLAPKYQECF